MRVLVLGITGHLGNAIARELIAGGHHVTGVNRRAHRAPNLAGLAIRRIRGDINDGPGLASWVKGHDVVVDAAAPYPIHLSPRGPALPDLLRQAERRTRAILAATRKHGASLVYVSTFGTLPQRRHGLDRFATDLMRRMHPYFALKEDIENRVLEAARGGQPALVVNPTGCLGPWDCKDRQRCFVPALLRSEMPGATDQMLNVIDVRDAAAAIVAALAIERHGEPIALSGHNISNEMLFRWICEIGGVRPPPLAAPSGAAVVGAYLTELALGALRIETPLPALIAILTYMHGFLAPSRAQEDLGVDLRPLSATLLDAITWYRAIGYC
jgi:dihydroflavonol-4-reductase